MEPRFLIKYGRKEHLQQIIDGSLRFTPSQTYVKMEELQHNKGQGDLLEGKMKIKMEAAQMRHLETDELVGVLPSGTLVISIQDVNDMPIFCLSQYGDESVVEKNGNTYITIEEEHLETIVRDFSDATHALVILEPTKFISDVQNCSNHKVISDEIHYYDYDINTLQMYMFLTTGDTTIQQNQKFTMTYDNRYRHLLCKDIVFKEQQEYRFICLDELIKEPVFYPITFSSNYLLVPIDELKGSLKI